MIDTDQLGSIDPKNLEGTLKLVGAVDIGYSKSDPKKAIAALVVCEYPSLRVLYEDYMEIDVEVPYVPGFLAQKELPSYIDLYKNLLEKAPEFKPQVMLVDGQGVQHIRVLGSATSLGIKLGIPTIGVAKSYFEVDGMTKQECRDLCSIELEKPGDSVTLIDPEGTEWGVALRCTKEATSPIYISHGHKISLETSVAITKMCIDGCKIPVPIREADLRGRVLVRKIFDKEYYKDLDS